MAITVSLLGTPTFNTTSGTKTVTATPAVGDLIIIITAHSGNTSTAAPTDNQTGGTYTLINSAVKATSADTMRVWVRNNLISSATSTIFTHAPGTTTGGGLVVIDCQGMDKAGSSAIVQSAIQSNAAAGTPAPVFATAPNSANAIIGAVFNARNPAALTPRTNYTELYDSGYNNPATGLEVMADNSGETSATITWGGSAGTVFASLVVELEASVTHATTGTLTGQIGSVSGTTQHNIPHPTSGTLTGQGSSIVGDATNFTPHSTSGTLTGQDSTLDGVADREAAVIPHTTDGVLVGQGATTTGDATRFRAYGTSGTLTGQGSVVTGDADHVSLTHEATGDLAGQTSIITGKASTGAITVAAGGRGRRPSIIIVEVDGVEYRVPETQLQAFLDALKENVEQTKPVKKKRKKKAKNEPEVVEVASIPKIQIKSAPIELVAQIQSRLDSINDIMQKAFSKALQQYVQQQELEKITIAKRKEQDDEEDWLLMVL